MKPVGVFIVCIFVVAAVYAAPARPVPVPQSQFENIKVLNDMSDTDIRKEMMVWTDALGVQCSYCHESGNFAADSNPKKETARKMATMVKTINKDFLGGKASCVLCHRGSSTPDTSH